MINKAQRGEGDLLRQDKWRRHREMNTDGAGLGATRRPVAATRQGGGRGAQQRGAGEEERISPIKSQSRLLGLGGSHVESDCLNNGLPCSCKTIICEYWLTVKKRPTI